MFLPSQYWALFRCCVLGQDTLPSHASLDSGVNEYLVGQRWQCVRLVPSAEMAASAVCSKKGVEMVHEWTGPVTRGNMCEAHRALYVRYIRTHHYYYYLWFLQNYMENGWELMSELTSKWKTFKNIQSIFTLSSLITFEVLNQTLPNLQGGCRNTSRWCLQNYMEHGWELTSELTSQWITFKNIQSIFTLISLITFEVLNQTLSNLQGSCRNTSRWCLKNYMENGWELTSESTSKWITFKNIQLIFTISPLITFEVLNQTLPNLQGSCRNTSRWCLQNYIENDWELTSELTSKWITFKNIQSIFTLSSSITFEVLNQTLPNLHGSCRNTSRWCLQKYIEKRLRIDIWYDVLMNNFFKIFNQFLH